MKNTAGVCPNGRGCDTPEERMIQLAIELKKETEVSLRLTTFVLLMYNQLTSEQRYAISVLLQQKMSKKSIAEAIGVHYSTVYREINRNKGKRSYGHVLAHQMACERKERLPGNRAISKEIKAEAVKWLSTEQWSSKQISGYLKGKDKTISHETIYRIIRKDKEAGGTLYTHCRHKLKHRKRAVGRCPQIPNRTGIGQRDPKADGTRFGDWEMDTIVGKDGAGAMVTLTERATNFLIMEKLENGKDALQLAKVVIRLLFPYRKKILSITTDNGAEFAKHQLITDKLGATVFFADPYASWQKGAIENANKLIRQYITKGSDFKLYNTDFVKNVQAKINRRPREKLKYKTPKEVFFQYFN